MSRREFGLALTERGFERKTSNGVWYLGLGLKDLEPEVKVGKERGAGRDECADNVPF
jgi:hypothetical protein